ncbi:apoptosis-associated speck-like protein containing a CARD [Centroberyx gerrardi]|uniref:apoptosis-associated speck-like protein containing a CARD n=1 Tax=Centroberyx gerrardi TaxID=166262 RepID=UPI003AAFF02F
MPPKTIKNAIKDMLEDLGETQLKKFRSQLLDRREEPRVRRRAVEGKDIFDISDVLVSTFTEPGALKVSLEILREIDCNEEADRLAKETSGGSSTAGSSN